MDDLSDDAIRMHAMGIAYDGPGPDAGPPLPHLQISRCPFRVPQADCPTVAAIRGKLAAAEQHCEYCAAEQRAQRTRWGLFTTGLGFAFVVALAGAPRHALAVFMVVGGVTLWIRGRQQ